MSSRATPGRQAWLSAGFPVHVPSVTIERKCGSGQQAVEFAAHGIIAGAYDIVIAGGVESMSRVPMGSARMGADPWGAGVAERFPGLVPQGVSAELVADKWGLSRVQLDEYAARSQARAAAVARSGGFDDELATVTVEGTKVEADESIRPDTTVERLAGLKAVFGTPEMAERFPEIEWKVTAGNSSQITDGAAALLLMSEEMAARLGLRPRARIHASSVVGDDPLLMLTGPIPATHKVLARAGLSLSDIDAVEVNEAFASVPLAWQAEFPVADAILNPRGGAVALGHPLGASGARHHDDAAQPPGADRRPLRAADHVRGRRDGQRDDRGEARLMDLTNSSAVVTGGASGLGLATVEALVARGVAVTIVDLPQSPGKDVASRLGDLVTFGPADVRDAAAVDAALDLAVGRAPLRTLVHCAGRGGTVRLVNRDGTPGDYDLYREIVDINLVGTFNVLRLAATRMSANEPVDGERGVCVLTASVAAWEGQIGQIPYASAKAGVVGMTLVAARDLSRALIRVCSIAPGVFDTPILSRFSDEIKQGLAAQVPHPARLGQPAEFASTAMHIVDNPMLNGETIRLDGAIRMAPR